MRELSLEFLHDDGDHLVLSDSDGQQYSLRIDEALRAAVRRDRPALGMIQAAESAPLRPREIQAMLRAGRDAEEIAEIAGVGIEHVRRYEGPVLAEREYTAERARGFHVGRGGGPTLGDVTAQRLRVRRASPEQRWDAWRNEDGTWTLELAFEAGGRAREAHWIVDLTRQSVAADDDEARWLTDDDASGDDEARPRARLTAVRSRVYDVEADGGVDPADRPAPASRRPRSAHPAAIGEDELDSLNARRGLRPVPAPAADDAASTDDDAPEAPSVWTSVSDDEPEVSPWAADDEALREHEVEDDIVESDAEDDEVEVEEIDGDEDLHDDPAEDEDPEPAPAPSVGESHRGDTIELTPLPGFGNDEEGAQSPAPAARKKPRPKRSSIPSWDQIVFGSKPE
ncbi:septation protein SepH [Brachybacterium huguangmaarense]